jgi:enoyl-CoA hydratase/carnithine racemase
VRAVVLAAEGPAFCAGANLNWMRRMADYTRAENIADAGKLAEMLRVIYECPKPTMARVQGDVYAGGMGLVAACDMAVAVDTAGFCLSEVKLGLIPATISPYVIRAMGARAAHRYFLTAERFGAAEALRIGFVHEVVAADQLDAKVDESAQGPDQRQPQRRARLQAAGAWTWPSARSTPADRRHRARHCRHPRQRRGQGRRAVLPAKAQAGVVAGLSSHACA